VFGVFLNLTRIALVRKNLVIDIILENGARGEQFRTDHKVERLPLQRALKTRQTFIQTKATTVRLKHPEPHVEITVPATPMAA